MKILVAGSRGNYPNYKKVVYAALDQIKKTTNENITIIEGCCPESADQYAEQWAQDNYTGTNNPKPIWHHPATSGTYLKRNIEMIKKADYVICFWNQYSHGTAHVISHATMNKKKLIIFLIKK